MQVTRDFTHESNCIWVCPSYRIFKMQKIKRLYANDRGTSESRFQSYSRSCTILMMRLWSAYYRHKNRNNNPGEWANQFNWLTCWMFANAVNLVNTIDSIACLQIGISRAWKTVTNKQIHSIYTINSANRWYLLGRLERDLEGNVCF